MVARFCPAARNAYNVSDMSGRRQLVILLRSYPAMDGLDSRLERVVELRKASAAALEAFADLAAALREVDPEVEVADLKNAISPTVMVTTTDAGQRLIEQANIVESVSPAVEARAN